MDNSLKNKRVLNVSQAALYSGYSRGMVESWLRKGLIPYESPPGQGEGKQSRKYIRRDDLDKFLDRHYQGTEKAYLNSRRTKHEGGYKGVTLLPRDVV
jgi:hypothetical protein